VDDLPISPGVERIEIVGLPVDARDHKLGRFARLPLINLVPHLDSHSHRPVNYLYCDVGTPSFNLVNAGTEPYSDRCRCAARAYG
jgi:hypothetical protein